MCRVVLGDNDAAGRSLIEAMNDAGPFHTTDAGKTAATVMQERVNERVLEVACCRVDNHAGRFVDDDEVVVFVEDFEGDCFRLGFEGTRGGNLDGDAVAGTDFVAGFGWLVVDERMVVFDELLEKGARAFRHLRLQEPVEPLAAFVVGDGEHGGRITQSEASGKID